MTKQVRPRKTISGSAAASDRASQKTQPSALAFPRAVEDLLQTSLELRDRYAQGEISERGMSIATGKLEAKLERMLETRRPNPANRRLAHHLEHERL